MPNITPEIKKALLKLIENEGSALELSRKTGIPRSAIRGMVGHVSDVTTDNYSQDKVTPRLILNLPSVCKNV